MKVIQRLRFKLDMADIWDYVAEDSEEQAYRELKKIDDALRRISFVPMIGKPAEKLIPKLRMYTIAPYVIFYVPRKDHIECYRCLHGARDVSSRLIDDLTDPTS